MSKLIWDGSGNRRYSAGVDRGLLCPRRGEPVVWNGLTSIEEAPSDVVLQTAYFDGQKKQSATTGSFAARVHAFTYPDELLEYDGMGSIRGDQNLRYEFNLSYRTFVGNDTKGLSLGSRIHLVYNAILTPSGTDHQTVGDGTDPTAFSWDLTTRPARITGHKPSAHLIIDTETAYPSVLSEFENLLYGTTTTSPRFPSPDEVVSMFDAHAVLIVTDNGDGTWTAEGPADVVYYLDATSFEISWPSAVYIDYDSYTLSTF